MATKRFAEVYSLGFPINYIPALAQKMAWPQTII